MGKSPGASSERVKNDREKAHRAWGRTQGDTELTGKVPNMSTTDRRQVSATVSRDVLTCTGYWET